MADEYEYAQHLEEEIADLEGENELLSLEVERLQEKFDLLRDEVKREGKQQMLEKLLVFGNQLGIDRIGGITPGDDPDNPPDELDMKLEAWTIAIEMKIKELKKAYSSASPRDVVRFMIKNDRPSARYRDPNDMYGYGKMRSYSDPRRMYEDDWREEQYESYQMTVNDLQKDHLQAIKALNFLLKRTARDLMGPSHLDPVEEMRRMIVKEFGIRLLEHMKDER